MTKIDFRRTLDSYRAGSGEFRVLDVPPMRYVMVDGRGDPNTAPEFTAALEALYPVAYKLKFASKQDLGRDYVVPPLEGLWWSERMETFTSARDKSRWNWTIMSMIPEWITREMFEAAVIKAAAKNPSVPDRVRLETLTEGRCVQTLHIGSFDDEGETLARMHHDFIPASGLTMTGRHHEIYLSDFRRTAPAELRTILRQPVTSRAPT
ncbi:GyrI-like domain-containing protein [Nocardia macrotermitis]|uniref:GyrI-like small molecule binding domain-containing protein n=1 Tax=Nocardia macrotermitis TaxID=2585198 RepID=A0A7K0DA72_9NOCA|nr:GyrI-like domain-containing protein [Nocardia macrotermitis]MQY22509.1 hypothetical protein [Nocardia macrotermitis]